MQDYSKIIAKIKALEAMLEQNSITPTLLGSLLEEIVTLNSGMENSIRTDFGKLMEAEATSRVDADTKLRLDLDTEASVRATDNTELRNAIAILRKALDEAIKNADTTHDALAGAIGEAVKDISDEATTRAGADAALGSRIDTEKTNRQTAINEINRRLGNIANTLADRLFGVNPHKADLGQGVKRKDSTDGATDFEVSGNDILIEAKGYDQLGIPTPEGDDSREGSIRIYNGDIARLFADILATDKSIDILSADTLRLGALGALMLFSRGHIRTIVNELDINVQNAFEVFFGAATDALLELTPDNAKIRVKQLIVNSPDGSSHLKITETGTTVTNKTIDVKTAPGRISAVNITEGKHNPAATAIVKLRASSSNNITVQDNADGGNKVVGDTTFKDGTVDFSAASDVILPSKLDKTAWDERNGQFTLITHFIDRNGEEISQYNYAATPYIPITRGDSIKAYVAVDSSVAAIAYYNSQKKYIGCVQRIGEGLQSYEILPKDIPASAVYFRVSSIVQGLDGERPYYSNGSTFESREGATSDAIAKAKFALFVDMWNAACISTEYGRYDPINAPDEQHPFYISGLWLTYEEALHTMSFGASSNNIEQKYAGVSHIRLKTVLPYISYNKDYDFSNAFSYFTSLEALDGKSIFKISPTKCSEMFMNCTKLKHIKNPIDLMSAGDIKQSMFKNCEALITVKIYRLGGPISFADSPLLSLESLQYLVANAENTGPITVTVHADVYAKLTDETNTEWHKVMTDAIAKNIAFATV